MKRIALVFLIVVPIASAAAITAGAYTVNMPPASIGTPSAFLSNFVTTDFTIVAMGSRSTEPFFPVRCVVNDPLAASCTITAGTSYSATYTNLNQTGMTLLYNGATYTLGGGSCGTCFALPWQLTLTYSPTTSFTYGPAGAPGVPGAAVLYNLSYARQKGSGRRQTESQPFGDPVIMGRTEKFAK